MHLPTQPHLMSISPSPSPSYSPSPPTTAPASARILILHIGGTLGMDPVAYVTPAKTIVPGSGGIYLTPPALSSPTMLANVFDLVPEVASLGAALDLEVVLNTNSCRVTPGDGATIARVMDAARPDYDTFIGICGTDKLAYVATALSYMLRGFDKVMVITGSQRPLWEPRTDARQNLVDAVSYFRLQHNRFAKEMIFAM